MTLCSATEVKPLRYLANQRSASSTCSIGSPTGSPGAERLWPGPLTLRNGPVDFDEVRDSRKSMQTTIDAYVHEVLKKGIVIPAHPIALTAQRRLDERRQRALTRYYAAAGAGGLAVGVHTTQFAIRQPSIGLFAPVLRLAAEEMDRADSKRGVPLVRIGGICGETPQAIAEATQLSDLRAHTGLRRL